MTREERSGASRRRTEGGRRGKADLGTGGLGDSEAKLRERGPVTEDGEKLTWGLGDGELRSFYPRRIFLAV